MGYPSRLTWFTPPPKEVTVPKTFTVILYLERADLVYYLANKPVNLYRNGVLVASTYTSKYGTAWISDTIEEPGEYDYYAEFPGDELYDGCRSPTVTTIAKEVPIVPELTETRLDWVEPPPSKVESVPTTVICSVRLTADGVPLGNKDVWLYQDSYTAKSGVTDRDGVAVFSIYIPEERSFKCHAEFKGDGEYAPSRTDVVEVLVEVPVIPLPKGTLMISAYVDDAEVPARISLRTVSYTHLTLPTICSV